MRLNEEKLISEAEYGSRNIPLTTNAISLLIFKLPGVSIKAEQRKFLKRAKLDFYLTSAVERVP